MGHERGDEARPGVGGTASGIVDGQLEIGDECGRAIQDSSSPIRINAMYPSVKEVAAGSD